MKKFLFIGIGWMMMYSFAMASFSIRPILGYGIGAGKRKMGVDYEEDKKQKQIKNKNMYYNAGQGVKLGLEVDYSLSEELNIGIEIGLSSGKDHEIYKIKQYHSPTSSWHTLNSEMKTSYKVFSPTIKLEKKIGGEKEWDESPQFIPFCVFGIIFALGPKSTTVEEYKSTYTENMEKELTYKQGIGICGTIGVEYTLSEKLGVTGEMRVEQLSLKAKHDKLKKHIVDGKDMLPTTKTRVKETIYEEDNTKDNPKDPDVPCIRHTFIIPANSVSIMLGIVYRF